MGDAVELFDYNGRQIELQRRRRSNSGRVGSGAKIVSGRFDYERAPELTHIRRRHETYRQMGANDPYIAEQIRSNTLPLIAQATWQLVAGDPIPPHQESGTPEQERSTQQRNLAAANLYGEVTDDYGRKFRQQNTATQWLREKLKFIEHGFSLFHKEIHEVDGWQVYRRLQWLEPSSVWEWDWEEDGTLKGIWRQYQKPTGEWENDEYLKASEICLYGWDVVGNRFEGNPLLRALFGGYKRKEFLLRCKMIAAQRAAVGLPWATRDPERDRGEGSEVADMIEQFMQSGTGAGLEHGYVVIPNETVKMGYLQQDPEHLKVFDDMVEDENMGFAHGGSNIAGMLGQTATGARAVGEVQQELMFVMVQAIGEIIAEQDVEGVGNVQGPIEWLLETNFPDVDKMPTVQVTDIDPNDRTKDLPLLYQGVSSGVIQKRPSLERIVLDRLNFEVHEDVLAAEDEELEARRREMAQRFGDGDADDGGDQGGDRGGDGDDNQSDELATEARRRRITMDLSDFLRDPVMPPTQAREKGLHRSPTRFESVVLVTGEITTAFTNGQEQMTATLRRVWRGMVEDVSLRIEAGKVKQSTLRGFRRSKPMSDTAYRRSVRRKFMDIAGTGRRHAEAELRRQEAIAKEMVEGVAMQDDILPEGAPLPAAVRAFIEDTVDEALQDLVDSADGMSEATVDSLWARLVNESANEYTRLAREQLPPKELEQQLVAFINDLSEGPVEVAGRTLTNVSYNEGRGLQSREAAIDGRATWALRSELLDANTCEPCARLDGVRVRIGSPEAASLLPPAQCLGGDRCRGIIIPISSSLQEAAR